MATTTATLTLTSTDLLTDSLSLSNAATLTGAGNATGLLQTTGLARTNLAAASAAAIQGSVLYRAGDYGANLSNKVYIANMSVTAAQYATVFIDQEQVGRLYAGDWMFMPWSAVSGTKQVFTVTIAGTWVAGETWTFDGVTVTAPSSTVAAIAAVIDTLNFPNWTTTYVASEATVIFTARYASGAEEEVVVTADGVIVQAGGSDATAVISSAAVGSKSESDITIRPSVHTGMVIEHMLIHE